VLTLETDDIISRRDASRSWIEPYATLIEFRRGVCDQCDRYRKKSGGGGATSLVLQHSRSISPDSIYSGQSLTPSCVFPRVPEHSHLLALVLLTVFLIAPLTRAQDNYEIQVYGSDLVDPGHTMVELHSNFTVDGSKTIMDGVYPTNHAEHETVEITHGFNDWFECGFYIFTSVTEGQSWQWVGDHIRPRVAVPKKLHWPVGVSLSNEIGYQRRQYSVDTWTWEIRPIVDQKVGRWYWALNPTLDRSFHGESVNQGVVFSPNFKFSYDFNPKIAGGLEYYGSVGPVTGFDAVSQQQHQIFPAIDLNIAPQWEINFGLGVGLTGATDHLIAKMILGYRFNF
jgi:hypothetical protein